ncbi:MAG: PilT/PilU family type 4a pilus ATPase [Erysipelotrichaceae bacterium]
MEKIIDVLSEAVKQNVSDVFVIAGCPYAYKRNGEVEYVGQEILKPMDCEKIIGEIYRLAGNDNYENFMKTGDDDFSFSMPQLGRFRVNAFKQRNSQSAAIRVVRYDLPDPIEMHIPKIITDLYDTKKGLILVTGPAGSGKSTTLACIIDEINSHRSTHIITIEDPIEYLHRHKKSIVSQREIAHDTVDYLHALRAALRQAPEVILLGEMRDLETINTAVTAAETGHLILSSLHTIGAANTIDRVIDVFPPSQQQQIRIQLSMVLHSIISQQLVPTIKGDRIPVFEIMIVNNAIRSQIRDAKSQQIENSIYSGKESGMMTMDESLYKLYQDKVISKETAVLYSIHPDVMSKKVKL